MEKYWSSKPFMLVQLRPSPRKINFKDESASSNGRILPFQGNYMGSTPIALTLN
jgi:hypothetical protein